MAGVDVLIITALRTEFDAARAAGSAGYSDHPGVADWMEQAKDTPVPFILGNYELANGSRLSVALARPTRMGGPATAPVVASLTERLRPSCLAMCGVCAGNPTQAALGDVVVAELAYMYDEGLRTPGGLVPDHRQVPLADSLLRMAQEITTEDLPSYGPASSEYAQIWLLECLYAGADPSNHPARLRYVPGSSWARLVRDMQSAGLVQRRGPALELTDEGYARIEERAMAAAAVPTKLPFAVVVGPMASGNVVVQDDLTWSQLAQLGVRTVTGLEMEAATIAHTAHRLSVPDWIVAKGVADYADPHKNARYQPFAARASAEVLFKLLVLRSPTDIRGRGARTSRIRLVYVIGGVTGDTEYPDYEAAELAEFCRRLGATVATAGADLIVCSPFPDSADFHALMGYVQSDASRTVHLHCPRHPDVEAKQDELRRLLGPSHANKIRNWYYPKPESEDGESWGQAWLLCQIMALDKADVVISVGGRLTKTANMLLHLAEARQKPVVPFAFLGGASRGAFNRRNWALNYPDLDVGKLQDRNAADEAMDIAEHMVTARIRGARSYAWPPRHIFISRARPDAEFARSLDEYLTTAGFNVLLGDREWLSDRTIESSIADAVLSADLFIVLWSRSFATSRFCHDELELAMQRRRVGELQVWIINLDSSDVVPRNARNLPQIVAPTPHALVAVVRDLLDSTQPGYKGQGP